MKTEDEKAMSFEDGMKRLNEINQAMDSEELTLEAMLGLYQEGMALSRKMTEQLDLIDKEIIRIEEADDHGANLQPLDEPV